MPSINGHGPKWAVLYARVSTDEQARSGYSLAQQMEALREYAAQEGYEVLKEIFDRVVQRARAMITVNKGSERKHLAREWELRGLLRCSCGATMVTHTTKPHG